MSSNRPGRPWGFPVYRAALNVRLVLLTTLITVVVVGSTFAGLSVRVRGNARRLTAEEVSRNQRVLLTFQRQELQGRLLTLTLLTESPTLRAAIDTYRLEESTATLTDL